VNPKNAAAAPLRKAWLRLRRLISCWSWQVLELASQETEAEPRSRQTSEET